MRNGTIWTVKKTSLSYHVVLVALRSSYQYYYRMCTFNVYLESHQRLILNQEEDSTGPVLCVHCARTACSHCLISFLQSKLEFAPQRPLTKVRLPSGHTYPTQCTSPRQSYTPSRLTTTRPWPLWLSTNGTCPLNARPFWLSRQIGLYTSLSPVCSFFDVNFGVC